MKPNLTDLIEKYLSGTITAQEQQELLDGSAKKENLALLNSMIDATLQQEMTRTPEHDQLVENSFQLLEQKMRRKSRPLIRYMMAATLIVVAGTLCFYWLFNKPKTNTVTTYTRQIVLPDSSIVLLHAGSSIQLLNGFGTGQREIELTGEAWFDVRHDAAKPFVVHTGQIKTTVLGTAFNIKAWPGIKEVVVAVTRGKVRVEDNGKTVATLTRDNQVTYSLKDRSAKERPVDAGRVVSDWAKKDVVFESISFKDIAAIVSKRYNVSIQFSNEALTRCHVRTSFKGTESLNEMLELLCTAMNATYSISNQNEVTISGEGCQ